MTDEPRAPDALGASLRAALDASLRAEMEAGLAPALGDIVAVAIRDGRRIRRRRRMTGLAGGLAVTLVAVGFGAARFARPPQALAAPAAAAAPAGAKARTLTVRDGTQRAEEMQKKATSAAMLHLLTTLLPPGRTSEYGVAADDDLLVQLSLDRGDGPAPVRVRVSRSSSPGVAGVTVAHTPGDCTRALSVTSARSDGTDVVIDLAACPPAGPSLSAAEAARIAADPRWGVEMDGPLVDAGAAQFPGGVPVFVS